MDKYQFKILLFISLTFIFSCCISACTTKLNRGYTDKNGHYIPKNPKFKLKDKKGNNIGKLDLNNIYRLTKSTYRGENTYPFSKDNSLQSGLVFYMKFYKNGRVFNFAIKPKNNNGNSNQFKTSDLNFKNGSKDYYYSEDGKTFFIETFLHGSGFGDYYLFKYTLDKSGNTLVYNGKNNRNKSIYKRVGLPKGWSNAPVTW